MTGSFVDALADASLSGGPWAIVGAHLIDPFRRSAARGGILIDGGQINAVGDEVSSDALGDVPSVDVAGRSLMPGMIDAHLHLAFDGGPRPIERYLEDGAERASIQAAARVALRSGATTIRDLGGPDSELFALREAFATGRSPGPRLVAAGRVVTRPGGHCHFIARSALGGADLRDTVRRQIEAGADVIKVMVTGGVHTPASSSADVYYDLGDLEAAARIAHDAGLRITAHATNSVGIERAILAGFDSVQHGSTLDPRLAGLMAARDVVLVPTLGTHAAMTAHRDDPRIPAYVAGKAGAGTAGKARAIRAAIEVGVTVAAGTDGGVTFVGHGALADELALLGEAGLNSMTTLAAATSIAAVEVGLAEEIGRLAPGYAADLIILDDDPVVAIAATRDPRAVISRGMIVARADPSPLDDPRADR